MGSVRQQASQTLAFTWSQLHDSIPIDSKRPRQRGSVQLIFSVIRRNLVGKNRVTLPYDGKDALRFSAIATNPTQMELLGHATVNLLIRNKSS